MLAVLSSEGLVTLERVTHDGTKVYANASKKSFRVKKRIEEHLQIAREHVRAMSEHDGDLLEPRRRAAQARARREREQQLTRALTEYDKDKSSKATRL